MATGVFATAITCIDGRTQTPVGEWVKRQAHADYVDTVTWPGPEGVMTSGDQSIHDAIRNAVEVSVRAHGSTFVAIAGHYDCAAFPAERERRLAAIRQAAEMIANWGLGVRVTGLYVNENWQIEVVSTSDEK